MGFLFALNISFERLLSNTCLIICCCTRTRRQQVAFANMPITGTAHSMAEVSDSPQIKVGSTEWNSFEAKLDAMFRKGEATSAPLVRFHPFLREGGCGGLHV